LVRRRLWF